MTAERVANVPDAETLDADALESWTDTGHQLTPARALDIPQPSVLDVLRQCRPSRELVALLSRESLRMCADGNLDDASALVVLALCVREVVE